MTYETTHPWLTFSVDLRKAPPLLWILLGECQSKCEHIAGVPLKPGTAETLYQLYLAKGILATTAIEGNTLSEGEVLQHLEGKLSLPPSREYLKQEIVNILSACNATLNSVKSNEDITLTPERVKALNRMVLNNLKLDDGVIPGEIRTTLKVGVGRYKGAPAEDCHYLLDQLCKWLASETFTPPPGMDIVYAILKAVLAHLYLAWIHPFGDGNGRTARLVEFQILITSGVPAPATHLMSNHYNETRAKYYRQLDQSSRAGGDPLPFLLYAVQGFLDGLRAQLKVIVNQQLDVAWENYVHEAFRGKVNRTAERRRHLILDISQRQEPVPVKELRSVSPRVAAAYASKTNVTISRDINALAEMGLLISRQGKVSANKTVILAYLPAKASR